MQHVVHKWLATAGPFAFAAAIAAQSTPPTLWQRHGSPDPCRQATLTFHDRLGAAVLFGGYDNGPLFDRTASFDGAQWRHLMTNRSPGPRARHAAAYDPNRQRLVVFGGVLGTGAETDDTWEFDGLTWSQVAVGTGPLHRVGHAMAYDWQSNSVLMFGGQSAGSGLLGDTWTWDGGAWTQQLPVTSPPARLDHAMASRRAFFPGQTSRVVLFGGSGFGIPGNLTWEWDGTTWSQPALVTAPPPARRGHAMVRNALTNDVVLFGGLSGGVQTNDTWAYNGSGWTQVATGTAAPPVRQEHGLAFDTVRGRVVLFGGHAGGRYRDTWEFDGSRWTEVPSSPGRMQTAVAFDRLPGSPTEGRLLMFGGQGNGTNDDTWQFDGEVWTMLLPTTPLPGALTARREHAMATLPAGNVMLFGGEDPFPRNDTYLWNGATWVQLALATSPTARGRHAMVSTPSGVVMFGGNGGAGFLGDTWRFAAGTWTQLTFSGPTPAPRDNHAMAYDSARNVVVLFGGHNAAGKLGDTWELQLGSSTWTQLTPLQPPAARSSHTMAYDAGRARVMLVGGDTAPAIALDDVWEWDGAVWRLQDTRCMARGRREAAMVSDPVRGVAVYGGQQSNFDLLFDTWSPAVPVAASFGPIGSGCAPVGTPVPGLSSTQLPWLGSTFLYDITNGPANGVAFVVLSVTRAVPPIPVPIGVGCASHLAAPLLDVGFAALPAGSATLSLPLPKDYNHFTGVQLNLQALVLDPQSRVYLTDAGGGVLGRR